MYNIIELSSNTKDGLDTEIKFIIATAKVDELELLALQYQASDDNAKLRAYNGRILNSLKKKGIIQFYIFSDELNEASTEASFLMNKYPEICRIADKSRNMILIKL